MEKIKTEEYKSEFTKLNEQKSKEAKEEIQKLNERLKKVVDSSEKLIKAPEEEKKESGDSSA